MKNIMKKSVMLLFTLMLTLIIIPMKHSSAETTPTELVWGQSYSGNIYGRYEYCEYSFTLPQSGTISLLFNITSNNSMGTGLDDITIYDAYNNELYHSSLDEGIGTVSSTLLAGDYKLKVVAGLWTGCNFSFTPSFTSSGETNSENYNSKNNEIALATSYKLGTKYIGQFAWNDSADVYVLKVKKTGFLTVNINSQIKNMEMNLADTYGQVSYKTSNIVSGTSKNTYFVPKGTYYISFQNDYKSYIGNYTFKATFSKIPTIKLKSVKNVSYRSMKLSWSRSSKVSGYQIQIATNKKFTKGKQLYVVDKNYSSSGFISELKKKKYYIRMRTYVNGNNNQAYYSGWSNSKKVTIKK